MDKKKSAPGDNGIFGNLFDGLEKLIDMAAELKDMEQKGGKASHEQEIDLGHLKQGLKGVYGFSVRTAVGGETRFEPFGNIRKTPQGPKVDEEREPVTDVFDEESEVQIIVEMPGVSKKDISVKLEGDLLQVSAKNADRNYRKELLLEQKLQTGSLAHTFRNGVLNIKISKQK